MFSDPFQILSNPERLASELMAMAFKCRLGDEELKQGIRVPFKFRKLLKAKKKKRPSLTPSGHLLASFLANRFFNGQACRFEFSVPKAVFLRKKETQKSYPFAGLSNAEKIDKVREGNAEFFSHWRMIGSVPIHDALVHRVLLSHLRQRIDPYFSDFSHAYRADPRRFSVMSAVRQYEELGAIHPFIVKLDIVRFFDTIDHQTLAKLCRNMLHQAQFSRNESNKLMVVIEKFMACAPRMLGYDPPVRRRSSKVVGPGGGIFSLLGGLALRFKNVVWKFVSSVLGKMSNAVGCFPGHSKGIVQGGALSTMLSNIYLHHFDKFMEKKGWRYLRYADDIVIFCHSYPQAVQRKDEAEQFLLAALKLTCGDKVKVCEPFLDMDYLGCAFKNGIKSIRQKTIDKFRRKIKRLTRIGQISQKSGAPCKPTYVIQRINNQLGFIRPPTAKSGGKRKCRFRVKYCWAKFIAAHHREFDGLDQEFKKMDRWIRSRLLKYWCAVRKCAVPTSKSEIHKMNRKFTRLGLRTVMEAYRRARAAMLAKQVDNGNRADS